MKRTESNENYFRIEVDTDALKRAEPDLPNFNKKDDLKSMMNEISNCLKFTDQQELQIDENKMNIEAIRVKESKLMRTTVTSKEEDDNNKSKLRELEKILLRNPASVTVILKTTKIFDKTHFLMLISKQERLVGGSSQASITNYEVAFSKEGIHSHVHGGVEGPVKQLARGGEAGVHRPAVQGMVQPEGRETGAGILREQPEHVQLQSGSPDLQESQHLRTAEL
jgi:hypothetical protein